jgi:hypothetical protein
MLKYFLLFMLTAVTFMNGQDDSLKAGWQPNGVLGLNVSQISLSNWTQGGEDALNINLFGNFGLVYETDEWKFDNKLKLSYGFSKLGSGSSKNTDNEIFMDNVLSHKSDWIFDPYISNTFRTVIVKGYDYSIDPKVQISQFFDPAYWNQGLGLTYQKLEWFTTRLGLGFQETFANKFADEYTDDPETPELEKSKFETGIEFVTKAEYPIQDNLLLSSELFMFGTFDALDVWDVRWDSSITAKISEIFNVNLNVVVVYDADQTLKTQIKEALQIGITYTLF